jgi:hypothetical protein
MMTDLSTTCHLDRPHPTPGRERLALIDDRILADQIALRRAGDVPRSRLRLAGIPSLVTLLAEQGRRMSRLEVAS